MLMDRRELCSLLPLTLLSGTMFSGEAPALASGVFRFADLAVHTGANGALEVRSILKGTLPTGEQVEMHESTLKPGASPHPPHRHKHSEFWLVREGTLELTINGKSYQIGPGSAACAASNDEHGIKNIGDSPATYFVVAVGPV
jgi:quercetin dioxygenase-like cupin family protein